VVVADHTKFDVVGIATIASLGDADVIVTDSLLDEEARRALGEHVDQVVLAPVPDAEPHGAKRPHPRRPHSTEDAATQTEKRP
jgi:hypothetical protein